MRLKKLMDAFMSTRAECQAAGKEFTDLQAQAVRFVSNFDTRLAHAGDAFRSLDLFMAQNRRGDLRDDAQAFKTALEKAKAQAAAAGQQFQTAKDQLTAAVEEVRRAKRISLLERRKAVLEEATALLTPYCDNADRARKIAEELDAPMKLEGEANRYRQIHDLENAARELINEN